MPLVLTNQQHQVKIPPQLEDNLENIAKWCLEIEKVDKKAEISLVFVDDNEIQELNKTYRGKDYPTDVLSFPLWDEEDQFTHGELLLGDIVISLETAQRQAKEYEHSFEREIGYLMIHGLLHLLGYDHMNEEEKKVMRQREEEILEKIELKR